MASTVGFSATASSSLLQLPVSSTALEESRAAAAGRHECSPMKRDWLLSLRHHQFSWKLGHPFCSLQTRLPSCAWDVLAPRLKLVSKAKQSLGSTTAGPDGTWSPLPLPASIPIAITRNVASLFSFSVWSHSNSLLFIPHFTQGPTNSKFTFHQVLQHLLKNYHLHEHHRPRRRELAPQGPSTPDLDKL